jgi:hypothetical protein
MDLVCNNMGVVYIRQREIGTQGAPKLIVSNAPDHGGARSGSRGLNGLIATFTAAYLVPPMTDSCFIDTRQGVSFHHNIKMKAAAHDHVKLWQSPTPEGRALFHSTCRQPFDDVFFEEDTDDNQG